MHDIVGMTDLELCRLKPVELYTQTHYIHSMGESQGKIMLEVLYIPFTYYTNFEDVCPLQKAPIGTPKCGGSLGVIIHEGKDLIEKHHNNPFVSLLFQGELRGTVVCILIVVILVFAKFRYSFTFLGFDSDFCSP